MPFTKEARAEMLDSIDGGSGVRRLALFVGSPVSGGTEITGTGYARIQVTMGAADAAAAPVRAVSTAAANWNTGAATDWPTGVNFLGAYGTDNTTLVGYMSLGAEFDMSSANQPLQLAAGDYIEEALT
jgi:hypothetical protein